MPAWSWTILRSGPSETPAAVCAEQGLLAKETESWRLPLRQASESIKHKNNTLTALKYLRVYDESK